MHEISWFTARIGKDVVRSYAGNDTVVTILKGEKADKYMHGLQAEGFTFRDTAQNIASAQYDFDLPEVEAKKSVKPRIHISDIGCESCSAYGFDYPQLLLKTAFRGSFFAIIIGKERETSLFPP